jgi:hypothetical protein
MKKLVKRMLGLIVAIAVAYLLILMNPNPLFAYESQYRNLEIHSDLPISESVKPVLDDAILRLEQSELYEPQAEFQLYLCNQSWRFRFFTRNGNAGGVVNFLLSPKAGKTLWQTAPFPTSLPTKRSTVCKENGIRF